MVNHIVWCVSSREESRRRVDMAGDRGAQIHVFSNATQFCRMVEVAGADGLKTEEVVYNQ